MRVETIPWKAGAYPGIETRKCMIRLVIWESLNLRSVTSGNRPHFPVLVEKGVRKVGVCHSPLDPV
jgi:hypothetical protein